MLVAGFWPRERDGPLVPLRRRSAGSRSASFVLVAGRIALNIVDSHVIDIGVAGVIGADRITGGEPLYEGGFSLGLDLKGDVYGPFNYLAYVPFELIFAWDGVWDAGVRRRARRRDRLRPRLRRRARRARAPAARRRARAGRSAGRSAFAWVACPWTLYTMNANANDALIAALGIGALLALRSAPARGALTGARGGGQVRPRGAGAAVRDRRRRAALARRAVVLGRVRDRRRRSSSSRSSPTAA